MVASYKSVIVEMGTVRFELRLSTSQIKKISKASEWSTVWAQVRRHL